MNQGNYAEFRWIVGRLFVGVNHGIVCRHPTDPILSSFSLMTWGMGTSVPLVPV